MNDFIHNYLWFALATFAVASFCHTPPIGKDKWTDLLATTIVSACWPVYVLAWAFHWTRWAGWHSGRIARKRFDSWRGRGTI